MKHKKLTALFLVITVFLLSFIIPISVSAQGEAPEKAAGSDGYVIAAEKDFEYIGSPKSNPKWALVTKYKGTDSKIIIPETLGGLPVRTLSTYVFKDCTKLTHIYIPAYVTSLSGQTFAECRSLTAIEVAPDHQSYVSENGILYNNDKTTIMAYPNAIGGDFIIPETVITIGGYAFSGAYNLTEVKMHNTVSSISEGAFLNCDGLKSIKLSDCLKVLGKKALASCSSLREIHLPASLSIIGDDAVLGDLSSKDDKQYYFTNGIYCAADSIAYDYVLKLGITSPYLKTEERSFTDINSGISLIDTNGILPKDKDFFLQVTPVLSDDISPLLPVRYNDILSFDISLLCEEEEYTLPSSVVIKFNSLPEGTIVTTAKIYRTDDTNAFELMRSPHTPFPVAQTKKLGTFTIINNTDFSRKGDIDGDGIITSYDARFALCIAAGLVPEITDAQLRTADTNDGNGVDTADAYTILRYAAGIEA